MSVIYVYIVQIDCCGINGTENEFEDTPWCNSVNSTCHDINAKIPRTCCTGVDDSNYLNADTVCYQQAKSYNTKVKHKLYNVTMVTVYTIYYSNC